MSPDDVPSSLIEFQDRFRTDRACEEYLFRWRWPEGFRCPRCMGRVAGRLSTRPVYQCRGCRRQTSVTAGTMLHVDTIIGAISVYLIIGLVWAMLYAMLGLPDPGAFIANGGSAENLPLERYFGFSFTTLTTLARIAHQPDYAKGRARGKTSVVTDQMNPTETRPCDDRVYSLTDPIPRSGQT